jgi:hypothetical protein
MRFPISFGLTFWGFFYQVLLWAQISIFFLGNFIATFSDFDWCSFHLVLNFEDCLPGITVNPYLVFSWQFHGKFPILSDVLFKWSMKFWSFGPTFWGLFTRCYCEVWSHFSRIHETFHILTRLVWTACQMHRCVFDPFGLILISDPLGPGMPFLDSDTCAGGGGGVIYFCQSFFPCMMPSMDGWRDGWMGHMMKKVTLKTTTTSFTICNVAFIRSHILRNVYQVLLGTLISFFGNFM